MSVSGPGVVMAMGGVGELLLTCKNQFSVLYTCTAPHREPLVGGGGWVQQRRGALPRAAPPAKLVFCTVHVYSVSPAGDGRAITLGHPGTLSHCNQRGGGLKQTMLKISGPTFDLELMLLLEDDALALGDHVDSLDLLVT